MLAVLSTLKARLGILSTDAQYDALLTSALEALGPRFDAETNRVLERTANLQQEFDPFDLEILARCYPIESVSRFELKLNDTDGWQQVPNVKYITRKSCVISLISKLSTFNFQPSTARVIYTGGYLHPTDPTYAQAPAGQQLPLDIQNAAVEQVAFWFQNREKIGLKTSWPTGVEYRQFATNDLLASVSAILSHYRRLCV